MVWEENGVPSKDPLAWSSNLKLSCAIPGDWTRVSLVRGQWTTVPVCPVLAYTDYNLLQSRSHAKIQRYLCILLVNVLPKNIWYGLLSTQSSVCISVYFFVCLFACLFNGHSRGQGGRRKTYAMAIYSFCPLQLGKSCIGQLFK